MQKEIKAKLPTIHELKDAKLGSPEYAQLEAIIKIKRKLCETYGIGTDIDTPDGKGHILTIHGRAIEVSLNSISVTQELHGYSKGNGGLHRTYLFKDFDCPLLLRSVEQLSDEECAEISKILDVEYSAYNENAHFDKEGFLEFVNALFTEEPGCYIDYYKANVMLSLTDYLRSIGIALPTTFFINGKVITYTVDDLIKEGIIKIVEQ